MGCDYKRVPVATPRVCRGKLREGPQLGVVRDPFEGLDLDGVVVAVAAQGLFVVALHRALAQVRL